MDEKEWLYRAAQGDEQAFEHLVKLYEKQIYAFAFARLRHREEARDAVQDVFIKVFRYLRRYDSKRSFFSWIYAIALNVIRDHYRRGKNRREKESDGEWIEDIALIPEHETDRDDKILLFQAIDSLEESDRDLILLRYIEGLPVNQMAEITGLSESNTKVRLHRIREKMKRFIQGDRDEKE